MEKVMQKRVPCIMLVDDDPDDNFFHERTLKRSKRVEHVLVKSMATEALNILDSEEETCRPDIILLDLNMPGMNGWEFLEAYNNLSEDKKSGAVVVMLTNSGNPDHVAKSKSYSVLEDYLVKPLTIEQVNRIVDQYMQKFGA